MAERQPFDSRTEAPSPRRREKARRQGDVASSAELNTGLILLAGAFAFMFAGQAMAAILRRGLQSDLRHLRGIDLGLEGAQVLFLVQLGRGLEIIGVILGAVIVLGLGAGVLQVGVFPSLEALSLKWDRVSPVRGWNRIFSVSTVMRALLTLLKAAIVAGLAWWLFSSQAGLIAGLSEGTLSGAVERGWDLAVRLALFVAGTLTVLGIFDYLFQRWRHERSLMMTRQERKDETKEEEGDPQVKQRIRKLQKEAAENRMVQEVPKATVVITNPTHLAIALRYDQGGMTAPRVVAKGSGKLAERLIEIARRHAVSVVEKKPLAQTLYKAVRINQEIPAALYHAVAEVLAYVYRLRGQAGQVSVEPPVSVEP